MLRLCHPCFNHIEYCTLSELRGVLEHPVHTPGYATASVLVYSPNVCANFSNNMDFDVYVLTKLHCMPSRRLRQLDTPLILYNILCNTSQTVSHACRYTVDQEVCVINRFFQQPFLTNIFVHIAM